MLSKQLEKIKGLYSGDGSSNKKKIENLIVLLIVLVITFLTVNKIWSGSDEKDNSVNYDENKTNTSNKQLACQEENADNNLQSNLENILSKIVGVGQVNVLLTYSESQEIVPLYDETKSQVSTEETDTSGGKRVTTDSNVQKQAIFEEDNTGSKGIITQKTVSPKIEGAIVIAQGRR